MGFRRLCCVDTSFTLDWHPSPPPSRTRFSTAADSATYTVNVTNTGAKYGGDEVVLAFIRPNAATIPSIRDSNTPVYGTFRLNFHRFDRFELDLRGHTQP